MNPPLVSVICLCYNHARFVEEAIQSVLSQNYENVELIVVDDASTDGSVAIIEKIISTHPHIQFIKGTTNIGNCAAFNLGLAKSKGAFVIDFAADDVLLPNRIEVGVAAFLEKGNHFGVQFSNPELIDEHGKHLGFHSDRFPHDAIPEGDIYRVLIEKYFISAPSMMVRREVFLKLNGYDESLAYEDFDFWIRSAREFHYFYLPQTLVKRRLVSNSMKTQQFKRKSLQQETTYAVCKKIKDLNRTKEEDKALLKRILHEMKVNLRLVNLRLVFKYVRLWRSVKGR